MTRADLDKAAAKYRRAYDRLYTASARANSAEECELIDAALAQINRDYDVAKAAYAAQASA